MAGQPLNIQIGNITISDFAVPERFPMGGSQSIAVHEFPGGARTIQTFGAFPHPVDWNGIFEGPTAMQQSFALDQARAQGQEVKLTWGPAMWLGVISDYKADVKNQWMIPYSIRFEPRIDLSGQAATAPGSTTPEATLASTQNSLNAYIAAPPAAGVQ